MVTNVVLERAIEYRDGLPVFTVKAVGRFRYADGSIGTSLEFRCPICGVINRHGGFADRRGLADGHRLSHCRCWQDGGYFIRETQ